MSAKTYEAPATAPASATSTIRMPNSWSPMLGVYPHRIDCNPQRASNRESSTGIQRRVGRRGLADGGATHRGFHGRARGYDRAMDGKRTDDAGDVEDAAELAQQAVEAVKEKLADPIRKDG